MRTLPSSHNAYQLYAFNDELYSLSQKRISRGELLRTHRCEITTIQCVCKCHSLTLLVSLAEVLSLSSFLDFFFFDFVFMPSLEAPCESLDKPVPEEKSEYEGEDEDEPFSVFSVFFDDEFRAALTVSLSLPNDNETVLGKA